MKITKCDLTESLKSVFIGILSIFLFFFGFFTNEWQLADQQWFINHQRDTESWIIGRMVKSRHNGIFSDGGLTGMVSPTAVPFNIEKLNNPSTSFQYQAGKIGREYG